MEIKEGKTFVMGDNKYNPYPNLCMGCGEHIYYCTCKKK